MKFLTDPCGPKGLCLVKACCSLHGKLWTKKMDCPEYKIYHDRKEKIESWIYIISELGFIGIFIVSCLWIIVTFILGLITEWGYIKIFIKFLF